MRDTGEGREEQTRDLLCPVHESCDLSVFLVTHRSLAGPLVSRRTR